MGDGIVKIKPKCGRKTYANKVIRSINIYIWWFLPHNCIHMGQQDVKACQKICNFIMICIFTLYLPLNVDVAEES